MEELVDTLSDTHEMRYNTSDFPLIASKSEAPQVGHRKDNKLVNKKITRATTLTQVCVALKFDVFHIGLTSFKRLLRVLVSVPPDHLPFSHIYCSGRS